MYRFMPIYLVYFNCYEAMLIWYIFQLFISLKYLNVINEIANFSLRIFMYLKGF